MAPKTYEAFESLLYPMPTDKGTLPHITPAMIIDRLDALAVVSAPCSSKRTFRWCMLASSYDDPSTIFPSIDESRILFICEADDVSAFLEKHHSAFAITEVDENHGHDTLRPYQDRLIAVNKQNDPALLYLLVQSFFSQIMLWECTLERIRLRHGTISDMLNASVSVIGNFMFATDNNFNVIAYTTLINPPDKLHQTIIKNKGLTPNTIAEKRFRLPEKQFYTRAASGITPYDRVSCPIHFNHSYFGSISMSCNNAPDTEGLRDLFRLFIKHLTPLCEAIWSHQAKLDIPSYFFFSKLISHEDMSKEYLESQLEETGLNAMSRFNLAILDIDNNIEPERARRAIKAASSLNNGNAICFPYGSHILVLLYSSGIVEEMSHRAVARMLKDKVVSDLGIVCGVTSVFKEITDLDIAYQQALVTLDYRDAIDREQSPCDADGCQGVYFFEEALMYYLVDPIRRFEPGDPRFIPFAFSSSIVADLYQEDLERGTDRTRILWLFLESDRNATSVAKSLHMHRNTVLYHIEKIEKQYHFDLSSKAARDWLLISFKAFFLTTKERYSALASTDLR